jgi:hypothetical protein
MRCKRGLVLLCLSAAAVTAGAVRDAASGPMACRGNEPFWQLQIDGATATYQRLGDAVIELAGSAPPLDYLPRPELVCGAAGRRPWRATWSPGSPRSRASIPCPTARALAPHLDIPAGRRGPGRLLPEQRPRCGARDDPSARSAGCRPSGQARGRLGAPAAGPCAGDRGLRGGHSGPGPARDQGLADEPRHGRRAHPQRGGRLVRLHRAGGRRGARPVRAARGRRPTLAGRRRGAVQSCAAGAARRRLLPA